MKTKRTAEKAETIATARNFLKATMPFVAIELANRIPGESSFRSTIQQRGAQCGALIETWSIRAAGYLTHHLVLMDLAEYCFDDKECSSIRLLVPFEQMRDHIATQNDALISDRFLSVVGPQTQPKYLLETTVFKVYCRQLTRYITEFFVNGEISQNAPISQRFEVDLVTEYSVLCSCDPFANWAVELASEVDEATVGKHGCGDSPFVIEAAQ